MFLVMLHRTFDDLPIKLCQTIEDARQFAATVHEDPSDDISFLFKASHTPDAVFVGIVGFENGVPKTHEMAKNFKLKSSKALVMTRSRT